MPKIVFHFTQTLKNSLRLDKDISGAHKENIKRKTWHCHQPCTRVMQHVSLCAQTSHGLSSLDS